ncbi:hypothetical protein [Mahella sp.]|uniref:ABC transporter permease n=1 Tax=Mahella sp. TaxID=2798721 RepID=UPI0025C33CCA|nr:hypothetical protein [Mahella sp.]MBZ4666576.1 hypothetical protein [Mahella sp.]
MEQLRYAWEDIKDQKIRNFVLFIQITAALVLFSIIVSVMVQASSYREKLNGIIESQEIYLIRDLTDQSTLEQIWADPDSSAKFRELYQYMKHNPLFDTYTADAQRFMWLAEDKSPKSLAVQSSPPSNGYNLLKIDDKFMDIYKLQCVEGSLFTKEDFSTTGETIPLLLGYDFRSFYQIGDIIEDDEEGFRYHVVGFLEQSSYFIQPGKDNEIYSLDRWFVIPVQSGLDDSYEYDSAIMSTYIITDDPSNLQKIQQKSTELGLYTFEFRSFTEQMERMQEDMDLQIKIMGLMFSVVLIFSMIGLISNLVQFIDTHTKEFAIHMLCGGQVSSIIRRILTQIILIFIPANVIVFAIHGASSITLATIAFGLVIGSLIMLYPAIKLSAIGINELLRRSE